MRALSADPLLTVNDAPVNASAGKTVFVVDDAPEIRRMIAIALRAQGHCVSTAPDGQEAQEMIQTQGAASVDLLITDLDMPRMRGEELSEWYFRANPTGRCLVISGGRAITSLRNDVPFLPKPFSLTVLRQRINDLLRPPLAGLEQHA